MLNVSIVTSFPISLILREPPTLPRFFSATSPLASAYLFYGRLIHLTLILSLSFPSKLRRSSMALAGQQTVDYPSFKLVIVGDGGT
ncbi:hypothetical protein CRG98_012913, partial [Punica granatum]